MPSGLFICVRAQRRMIMHHAKVQRADVLHQQSVPGTRVMMIL